MPRVETSRQRREPDFPTTIPTSVRTVAPRLSAQTRRRQQHTHRPQRKRLSNPSHE
ncbi:MAG TPA: hypothetical protein VF666_06170 [Pyrinomonadaceae bacterium]